MVNTDIVEYNYEHIINLVPTHNLICYRGEHLGYFLIYFWFKNWLHLYQICLMY